MASISRFTVLRHLRAEPNQYILHFRRGAVVRRGVGLAYWFSPLSAAVAQLPTEDCEATFLLHERCADYQVATVQCTVTYRIADPRARDRARAGAPPGAAHPTAGIQCAAAGPGGVGGGSSARRSGGAPPASDRRGRRRGRGQARGERLEAGFDQVVRSLPADQRRTRVDREQLDRFQFAEDDVVLVVGQDGLIPNAAKYLEGQIAIGINPDPDRYDGVLCRHPPARIGDLLTWLREPAGDAFRIQRRTMLEAEREDGQRLLALNEVFVGHRTHQSARYRLRVEAREERQSSSGLICASGTGCTGWALSIALQRNLASELPTPEEDRGVWFVREPFPSVHTKVSLDHGGISRTSGLEVRSEMPEGGVAFADGIESDRIEFSDGETLRVRLAERKLALVIEAEATVGPRPA